MPKPAPDALSPITAVKKHFALQHFAFISIGIDPTSQHRTITNWILCVVPMFSLFALSFGFIGSGAQYYFRDGDMIMATDALSVLWQAIIGISKWRSFMCFRKRMTGMVRIIWSRNLKVNADELEIIKEENRRDLYFSTCFYTMVYCTGILAVSAPFVTSLYFYLKGQGFWDTLEPPLKALYLLDTKTVYGFIIAFLWDVSCIYFVINGNLSTDTLFSWFIANISAQSRILKLRFQNVANSIRKTDDHRSVKYRTALISCIQQHIEWIEMANELNKVFQITIFIKFTISFIQIAILTYQTVRVPDLASQIFKVFFLCSASMQLLLYCYGGQRIQDESTSVSLSIYESFNWHEVSNPTKKMLLITMMRCQKPCTLTGIFFVTDLNLFLWVFKTAGSFITMLMTLEK